MSNNRLKCSFFFGGRCHYLKHHRESMADPKRVPSTGIKLLVVERYRIGSDYEPIASNREFTVWGATEDLQA